MIFYGTKTTNIKNDRIINVDCPNCSNNVSMNYSIFEKYAHIYWIPFFPVKKLTFAECNSCKKTFEFGELTSAIQQKINLAKGKVSSPIWMFSGLFIVGILVLSTYYSSMQRASDSKNYVQAPKAGDIYFVDESNGFYTTMKVNEVSKDSVEVFLNEMEIDKKTQIDKIDKEENYKTKEKIAKSSIQRLFKENKIYEVSRH